MASPNTPRARKTAMEQFMDPLRRATNKFVDGRLIYETPEVDADTSIILNKIEKPTTLPLRDGFGDSLEVLIQLYVRLSLVNGELRVTTVGYNHTLWVAGDEKLSYHWHPLNTPYVAFPHMHYDSGHEHIPTGRVLAEDIFLAALEFGARPKGGWKDCFVDAYEAFERDATWGGATEVRSKWLSRWDDDGNPQGAGL